MQDDEASRPAAVSRRRTDRATYLEQLSARILRTAERGLKERPDALAQVSALVGELILELRRVEDHCRELEAQLEGLTVRHRDLLDRIPVPCFLTDEHGVVTDANREALLLLRAPERHMIGKPAALWFKDRNAADRLLHQLKLDARPVHGQLDLAPRDRRPSRISIVVQQVDGVAPPLCRWFLLPGTARGRAGEAM